MSSQPPAAGDAADAAPDPPPLSKTQQKKLARLERKSQQSKLAKAERKRERTAAAAARRAALDARLAAMPAPEREAWRAEARARRAVAVDARRAEAAARGARLAAAGAGPAIVVDCGAGGADGELMTDGELRSLAGQLAYCHSANTRAAAPARLVLAGVASRVAAALRTRVGPGLDNWRGVEVTAVGIAERFGLDGAGAGGGGGGGSGSDTGDEAGAAAAAPPPIVYLTADSPNELAALDARAAYVVGGLVDRNRHKGLCLARAQRAGLAHARLPLGPHLALAGSPVLAVNHVVAVLLGWWARRDWGAALAAAVPGRKRRGGGGGGEGDGGGGGGGGAGEGEDEGGAGGEAEVAGEGNG